MIKKGSIIFIYTDLSHAMTIKETDLIQLLKLLWSLDD